MCPWQNYILWSHGGEPDGACEVLKLGSTFTTAFLLVFLYVWHMRKFEHAQFTNALLQRDTFMSSGILAEFVVEALFYLLHAPAFVNFEFETHYFDLQQSKWLPTVISSDELCTLVMIVTRTNLVLRTLRYLSGIESRQTRGYSNMNNLNITTTMSLRMLYNRFPIALMASLTGYLLPVFAFGMQVTLTLTLTLTPTLTPTPTLTLTLTLILILTLTRWPSVRPTTTSTPSPTPSGSRSPA